MKILAVDSSAGPSCAVYQAGRPGELLRQHRATHSQTLAPMINDVLKTRRLTFAEIDLFAVSAGPGSFRSQDRGRGESRCSALAGTSPVSGLHPRRDGKAGFWPAVDGWYAPRWTRGGVRCAALFETDGGKIRQVMEDTALSVEDLKKRVENHKKKVILIGDGAGLCYNAFGLKADTFLAPPHLRYQNAVGVAMEAEADPQRAVSAERLMPTYLRLPQAERELKRRLGQFD